MTKIRITEDNELNIIKALRDYYRKNFANGESTESFLIWMENQLAKLGEITLE